MSALGTWLGMGGTSWNGSDDAEGCASSGSVSFASGGSMQYCFPSATAAIYYLGMKGKGGVGCTGGFYSDTNCTNSNGYDFLNLGATTSSSWQDTYTPGVTAPSGTHSILIHCFESAGPGAIDQIYLNQGSSTGFGG